MTSTYRRSKASFGLIAFGATMIVAALASGNTSALSTPAGNSTFNLQNATASEGTNCEAAGWLFEATNGETLKWITLNAETGVATQGPLNSSTYFVQLPAGKSLSDLTTAGSTASIQYGGSDSSVTSFVLASVCSPTPPPTTAPPTTQAPPTTAPPTTAPPTTAGPTTTPSTTLPTNNETTTTLSSDSEAAVPSSTAGGATATTVAQLAETGSTDRLVVVLGLLLMSLGSVLYLVSRPTAAD